MFNVHDFLQDLPVDQIQSFQKKESLPFAVAVCNVNGELNTSNILRSAVVFGASKFHIIGRRRFDRRGCVGSQNYIDINHIEDEDEALEFLSDEYTPVMIEQGGVDINTVSFYGWRKPPCLIFGSEAEGLPEKYIDYANKHNLPVYSIAQIGVIRSLNVASAAAITIWKTAMDLRPIPQSTL